MVRRFLPLIFLLFMVPAVLISFPGWALDAFFVLCGSLALSLFIFSFFAKRSLLLNGFPLALLSAAFLSVCFSVACARFLLASSPQAFGPVLSFLQHALLEKKQWVGAAVVAVLCAANWIVSGGNARMAEVWAKYSLDCLPSRQLRIDSALEAGSISSEEASARLASLDAEIDFGGGMNGAGKILKWTSIANAALFVASFAAKSYLNFRAAGAPLSYGGIQGAISQAFPSALLSAFAASAVVFLLCFAAGLVLADGFREPGLSVRGLDAPPKAHS